MKNNLFYLIVITLTYSCSISSDTTTSGISMSSSNPASTIPLLSDTEIMDQVQNDVIKYFWDFAEINSKLARERYHTDNPSFDSNKVTVGGSGFGIMSLIIGVERGFISRSEAVNRMTTAMEFLQKADRFHGAWPHWIDGTTGHTILFSNQDDGGDIVETAFLCEGLIVLREYFKNGNSQEKILADRADNLWRGVEWSWYTKGENMLYWHWSPIYNWGKNLKIEGYNECLITYILGAASPTFAISKEVYDEGWTRNGTIKSSNLQYGIPLLARYNTASGNTGPLFWAHYSYLGLDPNSLIDSNFNYWELTQNHTLIINKYCNFNPKQYKEYSDKCWGLTASYSRKFDGSTGYSVHYIDNDIGVISPTAALSSFPYTPVESMKFLHYLYDERKSTLVGKAGPFDAFSPQYNWVTPRYLAIDQGTIAPMIENYRSGLIWKLFMDAPEVRKGLLKLGFHSVKYGF